MNLLEIYILMEAKIIFVTCVTLRYWNIWFTCRELCL